MQLHCFIGFFSCYFQNSYTSHFLLFASVRSMFECSQFRENFSLFQQLVADGVFETCSPSFSSSGSDFKTLAKLALSDPNKSHLLETYHMLKVLTYTIHETNSFFFTSAFVHIKSFLQEQRKGIEDSVTKPSDNHSLVTIERPCESLNQNFLGQFKILKSCQSITSCNKNSLCF